MGTGSLTQLWEQLGQDIDGEAANDRSGISVSLSADGTRVAIGADLNDGNGNDAGHTRIFEYNNGTETWTQLGEDIDGEAANDYSGISVSLSDDGTRVAIGADFNDGNGNDAGHTRIFEYTTLDGWTQLGEDIDGEAANDRSGISVSLSDDGNRVAIGAYLNDGIGNNAGHTRIFEYTTLDGWTQLGEDIDGEAADDSSGYSVSLSDDGNRVAIGAYVNDGKGNASGHTRIFEYNNGTEKWTQLGEDIDGEAANDRSGISVSLSADGTRVAIGAYLNDGNGNDAGHTRIFEYNNGTETWTQLGQDIDGEEAGDQSGISVSLSADGTRVAIGANSNDGIGNNAGHTRIFEYNGTDAWTQLGQDIDGEAENDESGWRVSLSADGTRVAIGALFNDGKGNASGHTRIFELVTR